MRGAGPGFALVQRAGIGRGDHRGQLAEDCPVAMTGYATLPEIGQIGGIHTQPALRNRGYPRHLGIGFQPAQAVAVVLFDGPQGPRP